MTERGLAVRYSNPRNGDIVNMTTVTEHVGSKLEALTAAGYDVQAVAIGEPQVIRAMHGMFGIELEQSHD